MKKFLLFVVVLVALIASYLVHLGATPDDLMHKPLTVFNDLILSKIEPGAQPSPAEASPTPQADAVTAQTSASPGATPAQAAEAPRQPAPLAAATASPAQMSDSDLIHNATASMAVVEGERKSGSGFVGKIGDAKFLLTNIHVVTQNPNPTFTLMDRSPINQGAPAVAVGRDVLAIGVPASEPAMEMMVNVDQNVVIGDEIIVLGNAQGQRVLAPISGKIAGIGPDMVEVNADYPPGCSGGPIIHKKSGKVIGVATYMIERNINTLTGQTTQQTIKRFGYRVDSIKQWQPISWPQFHAEDGQMEKIEEMTGDLVNLYRDIEATKSISPEKHQNPALKGPIHDFLSELSNKHISTQDVVHAKENLISFFRNACRADIIQNTNRFSLDYFQRELADEKQRRDDLADYFDKLLQAQSVQAQASSPYDRKNPNGVNR